MTRLHLVNGFLGSGKTTAIIEACRQHMARGERVGVVTNDQGRHLVDTALMRAGAIPAVQVTGGCFCCAYDQLLDVLTSLNNDARPDVIYAESVGSCADLIATVARPLLAQPHLGMVCTSLSVFADVRLLLHWLQGDPLPFSDEVTYILDRQLDEAGVLVLNKADLLDGARLATLEHLAQARVPGRPILLQDSLSAASVGAWVALIEAGGAPVPGLAEPISYDRYDEGVGRLAWVERVLFASISGDARSPLETLVDALVAVLAQAGIAIAHLKLLARSASGSHRISVTAADEGDWARGLPPMDGPLTVILNARLQCSRQQAAEAIDLGIARAGEHSGILWQSADNQALARQAASGGAHTATSDGEG